MVDNAIIRHEQKPRPIPHSYIHTPADGHGPNLYECLAAESCPDPKTGVRPLNAKRLERWFKSGELVRIISSKEPTIKPLRDWLKAQNKDESLFTLLLKFGYASGFSDEVLTPTMLGKATSSGWTGLHLAALSCTLKQLPAIAFTASGLRKRTAAGRTVFHVAANQGCLDQIPSCFLTRQNLLLRDKDGLTVLHELANASKWSQLPPNLIKFQDLFVTYKQKGWSVGITPIHLATCRGSFSQMLTNQPAVFWGALLPAQKQQLKAEINQALQRPVWFQSPERETQAKVLQTILNYQPISLPFTDLKRLNPDIFIELVTENLIRPTALSQTRTKTACFTQMAPISRNIPILDGLAKWWNHPWGPSHLRQHHFEVTASIKILIQMAERLAEKEQPQLLKQLLKVSEEQAIFSVYKSIAMHHTRNFKFLAPKWPLFDQCLQKYNTAYATLTWSHPETVTWFYVLAALRAVAPNPQP